VLTGGGGTSERGWRWLGLRVWKLGRRSGLLRYHDRQNIGDNRSID
jgi:hypothetical protein